MINFPDFPDLPQTYCDEALATSNLSIRYGRVHALDELDKLFQRWTPECHAQGTFHVLKKSIFCQKFTACLLDESTKDIESIAYCILQMAKSESFDKDELKYALDCATGMIESSSASLIVFNSQLEDLFKRNNLSEIFAEMRN